MILKSGGAIPERANVTILFAKLRGFTLMADTLDPPAVLARVSEFSALVAAAVERHEGTVVNVLNDTLMATFAGQGDTPRAVQAAREIRRDVTILKAAWQHDHGIRAAVAMGLHGGAAVIGFAAGTTREQPLVIGDSVSVAELLLHRARAGEIVVSKTIMDALAGSRVVLEARELPLFRIPPREPIRIFGVLLDTRLDFTWKRSGSAESSA